MEIRCLSPDEPRPLLSNWHRKAEASIIGYKSFSGLRLAYSLLHAPLTSYMSSMPIGVPIGWRGVIHKVHTPDCSSLKARMGLINATKIEVTRNGKRGRGRGSGNVWGEGWGKGEGERGKGGQRVGGSGRWGKDINVNRINRE
jgi:hypothetical protein